MTSTLPPVVEPTTTRALTTRGAKPPRPEALGRTGARLDRDDRRDRRDPVPFYWILRTALSSNGAISADPTSLLPTGFSLGGFERLFGLQSTEEALTQGGSGAAINFWQYLLNSVVTATMITVGQVFFSAGAAYAFARCGGPDATRSSGCSSPGSWSPRSSRSCRTSP